MSQDSYLNDIISKYTKKHFDIQNTNTTDSFDVINYAKDLNKYSNDYNICLEANIAHVAFFKKNILSPVPPNSDLISNDTKTKINDILKDKTKSESQRINDAYKALEQDPKFESIKDNINKAKSDINENFSNKNGTLLSKCGAEQAAGIKKCDKLKNIIENHPAYDEELREMGITLDHILCHIFMESSCDPNKFNPVGGGKGAQGLMQLRTPAIQQLEINRIKAEEKTKKPSEKLNSKAIDAKGKEEGSKTMGKGLDKNNKAIQGQGLFDANTNIQYGLDYLRYCLKRNDGSIDEAYKAYHGSSSEESNENYLKKLKKCLAARQISTQK